MLRDIDAELVHAGLEVDGGLAVALCECAKTCGDVDCRRHGCLALCSYVEAATDTPSEGYQARLIEEDVEAFEQSGARGVLCGKRALSVVQ